MGAKTWNDMSVSEQDEISDKFFKERDIYPYSDDGKITESFEKWLREEGFIASKNKIKRVS